MTLRSILASLVLSSTAFAAAESVSTRPTPTRTLRSIVAVLDADHNGTLSAREIALAPTALAALDLNDDGMISPDERRAGRGTRGATAFNVVFALDANHDGDIQTLEVLNAVSSLKRLDVNHDGELTPNELRGEVVATQRA